MFMLSIPVEGSLEDRLKKAAVISGDEPIALAQRVLDRNLPTQPPNVEVGPQQQLAALQSFSAGMIAWVSKHVPPGQFADDDRERIYEDRGE
jgi:hypothetical protein